MSTERIIDGGGKYRRPGKSTLATMAAHQAWLEAWHAALPPDHPISIERDTDHHWNRNHPAYNPECDCGDSSTPAEKASRLAAVEAVTEFDGDEEYAGRRAKSEARRGRKPMSLGQKSYLEGLARGLDVTLAIEVAKLVENPAATWAEASALIDRLKQAQRFSVRPNSFAQPCKICGQIVEARAGHLTNNAGTWLVEHVGACPEPEATPEPTIEEQAEEARRATEGLDLTNLPAGRYAIPGGDTRLKVQIDKPKTGQWKGYIFVKDAAVYGAGARYGSQTPSRRYEGRIEDELTAIMADPAAAMAAYGKLTNTCGNCYRALEDEESVERGIGPVCWGRIRDQLG